MKKKSSVRDDLATTRGRLQASMRKKNMHSNFKDLNPIYHELRH